MTWTETGHPAAGLAALLLGALLGLLVPRLIGLIPEPEPDPEPEAGKDETEAGPELPALPPKILYRTIADEPGLALQASVLSALGCAVVAASVGREWSLVFLLPVVPVGAALALVDARTRLLPTRLILPTHAAVIAVAVAVGFATDDTAALIRAGIGMVVVRSIFWVLWWFRSSGMGFGDVRLSALLAFVLGYLGTAELMIGIYAGFVVFGVISIGVLLVRRRKAYLKTRVPFGPFMLIGALLGIALGPWIATGLGY